MASDEVPSSSKKAKKDKSPAKVDDEEHVEPPSFSLASLGLQRVGTAPPPKKQPQQPIQALNARGMPARIRKRNRFFFDDNIINDDKPLRMSLSPKKPPKFQQIVKTPSKLLKKQKEMARASPAATRSSEKKKSKRIITPPAKISKTSIRSAAKNKIQIKASGLTSRSLINSAGLTSSAGKSKTRAASNNSINNKNIDGQTQNANDNQKGNQSQSQINQQINEERRVGHSIGLRLRNLLKLPKAHKWVIYEWFYSFIDKSLFDGENDFQVCLHEYFPSLKTRKLTRSDWQIIRAKLGKPRRCSQAFFDEERRELERKRQKIRFMQTRRGGDFRDSNYLRDLPEKIPMSLPVGTKVTARLRVPQDGIFSGTVDAYDSLTSTYRITFDRIGLGTHSIPDFEIVSETFFEMLPLQSITKDFRPNLLNVYNGLNNMAAANKGIYGVRTALNMNLNKSDPLLAQEIIESPFKNTIIKREKINGYPVKLLEIMVRLKRALAVKRAKIERLANMNDEAELKMSQRKKMICAAPKDNIENEKETGNGNGNDANGNGNVNKTSDGNANGNDSGNVDGNGEINSNVNSNSVKNEDNGISADEGKIIENAPEMVSCDVPTLPEEFQRRYAAIVISMERMNRDIQDYLNEVQEYSVDLTRDPQVQAMLAPSYLREKCREAAEEAVQRNNQGTTINKNVLSLIKNLATVLLVASHLNNDGNSTEVSKTLEGCIEEVRSGLFSNNIETFQKNVQIHLHHIRLGIGHRLLQLQNNSAGSANISAEDGGET